MYVLLVFRYDGLFWKPSSISITCYNGKYRKFWEADTFIN